MIGWSKVFFRTYMIVMSYLLAVLAALEQFPGANSP